MEFRQTDRNFFMLIFFISLAFADQLNRERVTTTLSKGKKNGLKWNNTKDL